MKSKQVVWATYACPLGMHTPWACMPAGMHVPQAHTRRHACPPPRKLRDAVNERAVRILLECILVTWKGSKVRENHLRYYSGRRICADWSTRNFMTFCASEVTVIVPQSNCAPKIPPQMLSKPENAIFQLGKKRGEGGEGCHRLLHALRCVYLFIFIRSASIIA